jgi:hypothetical protein
MGVAPSRRADGHPECLFTRVDRKLLVRGRNDANDPNVWSGRALQEDFVELAE